jgi:hypothetical protein
MELRDQGLTNPGDENVDKSAVGHTMLRNPLAVSPAAPAFLPPSDACCRYNPSPSNINLPLPTSL